MSAAVLLAKAEIRRRWPALLALALLAALGGAVVTSAVALGRRTTTTFDRLAEATAPADAQVFVNAVPSGPAVRAVRSLPGVDRAWTVDVGVGAVGDQKVYLGVVGAEDDPPPGLFRPIIVDGRAPDPDAPDEAMVAEEMAGQLDSLGVRLGDPIPLTFLTPQDYRSFDSGFGRPGGPQVDLRLVGTYQSAGGTEGVPPIFASPGFVATHPDALDAAQVVFLRLADGAGGVADLRRQVDALADDFSVAPSAEEFDPFQVAAPGAARAEVQTTARVLGGGLAAFAGVAALVALVLLGQGFNRYHGAASQAEVAYTALGVTSGQVLAARLLAAVPVALAAAALVAVGAVATAGLEPLGSLRALEPHPGRAVNVVVVAVGAVLTAFLAVIGVAAVANALWVSARRRRRDLAVLRVLGHTPAGAAAVVLVMAAVATVIGALVGLPVGIAIGRTLWRLVAESSAVQGDALVGAPVVIGVPAGALLVALVVAGPAAWLAGHRRPAGALRTE